METLPYGSAYSEEEKILYRSDQLYQQYTTL